MGQELVVKGHDQGSPVKSGSLVRGQGSLVKVTGQRSRVTSQGSLDRVKGHWSVITGQWSSVTSHSVFTLLSFQPHFIRLYPFWGGALWLSGRVSDSGARGPGFEITAAVLCPWARHFTPRKYWLITQEAMAPSRHDWKIVDWDVKPQHNQPTLFGDEVRYPLML